MPVRTFLDTSTAHLTWEDTQLLQRHIEDGDVMASGGLIAHAAQYGWTVSTSGMLEGSAERAERLEAIRVAGFSEHFIGLLDHAANQGVQMVRLDRDAECEPELPTFDWENDNATCPAV
jgi:hypothetical protein